MQSLTSKCHKLFASFPLPTHLFPTPFHLLPYLLFRMGLRVKENSDPSFQFVKLQSTDLTIRLPARVREGVDGRGWDGLVAW